MLQNTLKERNDSSRTRRTDEVPFIVASANTNSRNAQNYVHRKIQCYKTHYRNEMTLSAPAAQTRYLLSSPAATLHGKTQGFALRLPPHNKAHATFMQPFQCDLPFLTTSHRHHFPSSPLPFITTSLRHHFPSSPLPFLTTSHRRHFPPSPLPFLTTPLHHHFPSSPLP